MDEIGAAKFKEHCLSIIDHVPPEGLVITKHGKPVAKIIPFQLKKKQLIGSLKNKIKILDKNLYSTGIKWDAQS